jgi:hypothetical protein
VTISFGYLLYCVYFNLCCGCFNLFCNVWVCVCVGFVMYGFFFWQNVYLYLVCFVLFLARLLYCFVYVYLFLFVLSVLV